MSGPVDPELVDTHAHLDDPAFDGDRDDVLAAAEAVGVHRIFNVGYNPDRWKTTLALANDHPTVSPVLGLHPQQADAFTDALLEELASALLDGGARAVGEIGLDFSRNRPAPSLQRRAFVAQLDLAGRLGLPIVIHQRAAEDEVIDVLRDAPDLPAVVLHSFDGTARLARFALDRGYHVGVGGLSTRHSAAPLREVLRSLPTERLVLETDAPYLLPPGLKSRRNEPANVALIAERVAPLWHLTAQELALATTANVLRVFGPTAIPFEKEVGPT